MPVNKILRAERETIVVSGELSDQFVQDVYADVSGDFPLMSVSSSYNKKTDCTTIQILPYHIYPIDLPPEYKSRFANNVSSGRRIVFLGAIIDKDDIIEEIVEKIWMPTRKQAKRESDDLKWVVVTPRIVKDSTLKATITEILFFIETIDPNSHDPRGCALENVEATLDRATKPIIKGMCQVIKADAERRLPELVYALNEFSTAYANSLEKALTDAEMAAVFPG